MEFEIIDHDSGEVLGTITDDPGKSFSYGGRDYATLSIDTNRCRILVCPYIMEVG